MEERKPLTESELQKTSSATREACILAVIFVIMMFTAIQLDLFEFLVEMLEGKDHYEIDEFFGVAAIFSIFIVIFALRRWREISNVLRSREDDDKTLRKINFELQKKTEELENQKARSEKLSELANFLQVCKSKDEAFNFISEAADTLLKDCHGALYVTRDSRNQLSLAAEWGVGEHSEFFSPDDCWGLRLGKRFISSRDWGTPTCAHVGNENDDINVCFPLTAYGEMIGLLHVVVPATLTREDEQGLPVAMRQSLSMFSEQVSLAISNLTLHEKLKELAIHDSLTGLNNRQYMKETFEREIHRAKRNRSQLGIIMMDLDHFKKFNDTFGHPAGDMLLMELGKYLKSFFRIEDFCCRYGGEEFLILLSDIDTEEFKQRCQRLLEGIAQIQLVFQGVPLGNITASLGVAVFPEDGQNSSLLLEAADKSLYRAKKDGRNRVSFASQL